jgi:hypothetical protein
MDVFKDIPPIFSDFPSSIRFEDNDDYSRLLSAFLEQNQQFDQQPVVGASDYQFQHQSPALPSPPQQQQQQQQRANIPPSQQPPQQQQQQIPQTIVAEYNDLYQRSVLENSYARVLESYDVCNLFLLCFCCVLLFFSFALTFRQGSRGTVASSSASLSYSVTVALSHIVLESPAVGMVRSQRNVPVECKVGDFFSCPAIGRATLELFSFQTDEGAKNQVLRVFTIGGTTEQH